MLTQMESVLLIKVLPLIWKYSFVRWVGVLGMQEQGGGKKAKMEWGTHKRASNYMTDLASGSLWLNRAPFPDITSQSFHKTPPPPSHSHHILLHLLWIFGRSVCMDYIRVATQNWYSRGTLPAFRRVYISPQYWPRERDATCVVSVF